MPEKLILTEEDVMDIQWNGHNEYELVTKQYEGDTRWHQAYTIVFKDTNGKLYGTTFLEGATEYQDNEYELDCVEVKAVEETITKYVCK